MVQKLLNRQLFTSVNNKPSELWNIEFRVPQRLILGTLLFLIYINDLSKAIIFHQYITLQIISIFYTSVPP